MYELVFSIYFLLVFFCIVLEFTSKTILRRIIVIFTLLFLSNGMIGILYGTNSVFMVYKSSIFYIYYNLENGKNDLVLEATEEYKRNMDNNLNHVNASWALRSHLLRNDVSIKTDDDSIDHEKRP